MALLIKEFRSRITAPVRLVVGKPIARKALDKRRADPKEMMDFLRRATYDLAPDPSHAYVYRFEFEEKCRA